MQTIKTSAIICLLFVVGSFTAKAQSSNTNFYSCDYYEFGYWNEEEEKFSDFTKTETASMFEVSSTGSVIKHITPTISSNYYVQKTEVKNGITFHYVMSDVGNEYTFIMDFDNGVIKILNQKADEPYLIMHHIKSNWSKDAE